MAFQQLDLALVYKQLEHLEKEIQVIKAELARLVPMTGNFEPSSSAANLAWDELQDASGLWEREWDAEWESIWQNP